MALDVEKVRAHALKCGCDHCKTALQFCKLIDAQAQDTERLTKAKNGLIEDCGIAPTPEGILIGLQRINSAVLRWEQETDERIRNIIREESELWVATLAGERDAHKDHRVHAVANAMAAAVERAKNQESEDGS